MRRRALTNKVLLVVDDEPAMRKVLERLLGRAFGQVLTAADPAEADDLLAANEVTHLVTDCNLGPGLPLGVDLVPAWRERCPSIERAVVFSGTDLSAKELPDAIDAVLHLSADFEDLLEALEVEA